MNPNIPFENRLLGFFFQERVQPRVPLARHAILGEDIGGLFCCTYEIFVFSYIPQSPI